MPSTPFSVHFSLKNKNLKNQKFREWLILAELGLNESREDPDYDNTGTVGNK
jgi:hypothetical protein